MTTNILEKIILQWNPFRKATLTRGQPLIKATGQCKSKHKCIDLYPWWDVTTFWKVTFLVRKGWPQKRGSTVLESALVSWWKRISIPVWHLCKKIINLAEVQWNRLLEANLSGKATTQCKSNTNALISTPEKRPPLLKGHISAAKGVASQEEFHCKPVHMSCAHTFTISSIDLIIWRGAVSHSKRDSLSSISDNQSDILSSSPWCACHRRMQLSMMVFLSLARRTIVSHCSFSCVSLCWNSMASSTCSYRSICWPSLMIEYRICCLLYTSARNICKVVIIHC